MPTEAEKIIICSEEAAATSVTVAAASHRLPADKGRRIVEVLRAFVRDAEAIME